MFGWNALALALKGQSIYSGGCELERTGMHVCSRASTHLLLTNLSATAHSSNAQSPHSTRSFDMFAEGLCATQESKLAVLWTVGIFALNFGPVFVGPILDWVGPKLTTILGKLCCKQGTAVVVHVSFIMCQAV